jgi:hypothetical protein
MRKTERWKVEHSVDLQGLLPAVGFRQFQNSDGFRVMLGLGFCSGCTEQLVLTQGQLSNLFYCS